MHISEGVLSPAVLGAGAVLAAAGIVIGLRKLDYDRLMTVAILAKNNPIFVPLAAFFIAYLDRGCQLMATYCNISANMIDIIQGVIFLFFTAEQFLSGYRQKLVVKSAKEELLAAEGGAKA